ncbi:MAG TPA: DUF3810 family protein [Vicinamibacterales bacterium]|jgi:hypothetical protein|nr:DUF3810 family protein [Vicinamibacterales bacterium]
MPNARRLLEMLLIAAAIVAAVLPLPQGAVERVYSRGIYPMIQPRLTGFSNAISLSLFDVTAVGVVGAVLLLWVAGLRRATRGRAFRTIGSLARTTAAVAGLLYLWFLTAWGLNYRREPLRTELDFQEDRITEDALHQLALRDVDSLNMLYAEANGGAWPEFANLFPLLDPPLVRAERELDMSWRVRAALPKRSLFDFYFRRVAVDGMTDPFFLETLANQGLLPFERSFVIAHEWGHLAGYADESEANFFAWLVCMRGGAREQYSAWISLYGTIVSAQPPGDRAAIVRRLEPGPRNDLRAMSERISRQVNPKASRAGYAIYDRFLRANRVRAGIRSYTEVLRLLLGTRFEPDGTPALRSRQR